jgi:hypothetical protein
MRVGAQIHYLVFSLLRCILVENGREGVFIFFWFIFRLGGLEIYGKNGKQTL